MSYAALIPFLLLFIAFVGLKFPLTLSSMIAGASSIVIAQFLFSTSAIAWAHALTRTFELSVEIGLILIGAFFFLEAAKKTGMLDSLAKLIQEISSSKLVQGILVTFPLELLVEGSSGFGTPLLIITPILLALGFELRLCALLPFLTCIIGIPFGALGTPIRLGFPAGSLVSREILLLLSVFAFIGPLLSAFLITKKVRFKKIIWILFLSTVYTASAFFVSSSGPEFTTLAPAFLTFAAGVISARLFFKEHRGGPIRERKGFYTYALLLLVMWTGKQIWMDRVIQGTHIRIFNPGLVFIFFGFALLLLFSKTEIVHTLKSTVERAQRTLVVFACMTFTVQALRESGALIELNRALPTFLISNATPVLGWLGCMFTGTSTVTNLLFSKVVDPVRFGALGAGSAVGVQMAFQSFAAMKSVLHDRLSEKEIFLGIAPISAGFIFIVTVIYQFVHIN